MELGEASIIFEKEQLRLYTDMVNKHPGNEFYKRTQSRLIELIEDHENQIKADSITKPQQS
jgi:hypothetical protein